VHLGGVAAGLSGLVEGLQARRATGSEVGRTYWASVLGEAYLRAGRLEAAFAALADGFEAVRSQRERLWEPELYRLYGEFCCRVPCSLQRRPCAVDPPLGSDEAFHIALERATEMGSIALARRAASSLERLGSTSASRAVGQKMVRSLAE
jgi:hypothetical protein